MEKTKILYIIGAGRSGTTLLDILLGNQEGFFSAGELNRFPKRNGIPHSARGESVASFWMDVKDKINFNLSEQKELSDKIEYHKGILLNLFVSKKLKRKYQQYNQNLFEIISEKTSARVIIDSSKYPLRAKELSKIFQDKVSIIYIVRNPNDVVSSFQKKDVEQPSKGKFASHLYLLVVNSLCSFILSGLKNKNKIAKIRYNDLVSNPLQVIEYIESQLDIDLITVKTKISSKDDFRVGMLFDGNRLRKKNLIKLIIDKKESEHNKSFINTIFAPIHRLFWYN